MGKSDLVVRGGVGVFYDQINMNPFLDFRPPIAAASGLQGNPIGPAAVDSYRRSLYNWGTAAGQAQFGGAAVFPGLTTCSTLNNGTQAVRDTCGTNIYNIYSVQQN